MPDWVSCTARSKMRTSMVSALSTALCRYTCQYIMLRATRNFSTEEMPLASMTNSSLCTFNMANSRSELTAPSVTPV